MKNELKQRELLDKPVHLRFSSEFFAYLKVVADRNNIKPTVMCREILLRHVNQYDPESYFYL